MSLEAILTATVEILDREGTAGLTFRELAKHLGTGVGSLYWYVEGRDELLALASNEVLGDAVAEVLAVRADPRLAQQLGYGSPPRQPRAATDGERRISTALYGIRVCAISFFRQFEAHVWLAEQLGKSADRQVNSLRWVELLGQELLALELTPRQQFHAMSAVVNYVTGVGADLAEHHNALRAGADREASIQEAMSVWEETDEAEFPFLHVIIPMFKDHDDNDQMEAGLDLILSGIRQQAETRS